MLQDLHDLNYFCNNDKYNDKLLRKFQKGQYVDYAHKKCVAQNIKISKNLKRYKHHENAQCMH